MVLFGFIGDYFKKAKNTARIISPKATKWFQCIGSPLNTVATTKVKTIKETAS